MKRFGIISCVVLLLLKLTSGQVEDFEYELEEPEEQKVSGKIGNGTVSEHIPFMASLRLKELESVFGYGHICGAVFITRRHLLTAAVCVVRIDKDYKAEDLVVVAGVRNRYDASGAYKFNVASITTRSEYLRFPVMGMDGNLAILEVRQLVTQHAHANRALCGIPQIFSMIKQIPYLIAIFNDLLVIMW
jgi:secreted trypsin-like serine protease